MVFNYGKRFDWIFRCVLLQKQLAELEAEMSSLDTEYSQLQEENSQLQSEANHMKKVNQSLLQEQQSAGEASTTDGAEENPIENAPSVGEIHSMYQDLFLADMKKEVQEAQEKLSQTKKESMDANREIQRLRKEQAKLEATLNRYRGMANKYSKPKAAPVMEDDDNPDLTNFKLLRMQTKGEHKNEKIAKVVNQNWVDCAKVKDLLDSLESLDQTDLMSLFLTAIRVVKKLVGT